MTHPIAIVCANGCRVTEGTEFYEGTEGYGFYKVPSMPSLISGPSVSNVLFVSLASVSNVLCVTLTSVSNGLFVALLVCTIKMLRVNLNLICFILINGILFSLIMRILKMMR